MPNRSVHQPLQLDAVESIKSWGEERWLNSTRAEGPAGVVNLAGRPTLAEVIAEDPAVLGRWSQLIYGDELPIFTKLIRTEYPPLVHVGFNRRVGMRELAAWLAEEQAQLRALLGLLRVDSRERFDELSSVYSTWASAQAQAAWQIPDERTQADRLAPFVSDATELVDVLGRLRRNRAQLVGVLNEIDLRREEGNLLLTSAGVVHSIFGLSLQTHPLDPTRERLEAMFADAQRLARGKGTPGDLAGLVEAAGLRALRAHRLADPKNEAWMPMTVGGRLTIVESQQSSDTTYSLADFYTPFAWDGAGVRFRKGDPKRGILDAQLEAQITQVELGATSIDDIRRAPTLVRERSSAPARLYRIVDDPVSWPFFSAYRLELDGAVNPRATWSGRPTPGLFQQLVVTSGEVELVGVDGTRLHLDPSTSAFIPATMQGGYHLESTAPAGVLFFSVPGPYAS